MAKASKEAVASETPAIDVAVQLHARLADSPDLYEVLVGKKRVAFVCEGEPGMEQMPISFLLPATTGLTLTTAEKITIARRVRELMVPILEQEAAEEAQLAELVAGKPLP